MTNKRYVHGRALEYHAKRVMEREGYFVIRAAGSHGKADLVAMKILEGKEWQNESWLIQCKVHDDGNTSSEKQELIDLAKSVRANAAWWSNNRGRVNLVVRD